MEKALFADSANMQIILIFKYTSLIKRLGSVYIKEKKRIMFKTIKLNLIKVNNVKKK